MAASLPAPGELVVVTYGGGVNSVAALVQLARLGVRPTAITMADPGSEWPETYAHRDGVVRPWLAARGWPDIVVVTRQDELRHRRGGKNFETLAGLCERTASLPSAAYPPNKKCSFNYKTAPQRWWTERQPWAQAAWAAGRQIVKVIGYDADEDARVQPHFNDPVENRQYRPWYPLHERGVDRAGCVALIEDEGLAVPVASACTYCPKQTLPDWERLRETHPELFAEAVAISRRAAATVENPEVCGLMLCNPHGKRQLHVWQDGGYGPGPYRGPARDAQMPCECGV